MTAEARRCVLCGTDAYDGGSGPAEMHDPQDPEEQGGLVHADCGLARGWEIS